MPQLPALRRLDPHQIQALSSVLVVALTFSYVVATVFMVRASNRMAAANDKMAQNAIENLRDAREEYAARHRPYLSFSFDDEGNKSVQTSARRDSLLLPVKATDYGDFPAYHVNLWARVVVDGNEIFSSKEPNVEQTLFPKETLRFRIPVAGRALIALSKAPRDERSFLEFRAEYSAAPSALASYSFRERGRAAIGGSFTFTELGRSAD